MVTGLPGSGKTLLVNKVLDDYEGVINTIRINAMNHRNYQEFQNQLFKGLLELLPTTPKKVVIKDVIQKIKKYKKMYKS